MVYMLVGGIAQLGEHLPCKQGVSGSIPLTSTNITQMELSTISSDGKNEGL